MIIGMHAKAVKEKKYTNKLNKQNSNNKTKSKV
jgi:hypothetical protein